MFHLHQNPQHRGSEELVIHIEVDYEVHNEESMVLTSEVGILVVLIDSINVSTQSVEEL
jgi:hypothetical protein